MTDAPLSLEAAAGLFSDLQKADGILIAVSGGPDSTALMHLLAAWGAGKARPKLFAATIDHGLRAESRAEAEAMALAAARLGLPHASLSWAGEKPKTRIQEAARAARYRLLADHSRTIGASHLVTAHTLDDQAETVLFRLARGSGPKGLAGMRRQVIRAGVVHVRPFLGLRKARLVATCAANGWAFFTDPSNSDPRFARARWRALLPALEAEGLTPERIAVLSARIRRAEAALDTAADTLLTRLRRPPETARDAIDGALLVQQPEDLFLRVMAKILRGFVGDPAENHGPRLERLEIFCLSLRQCIADKQPFRRNLGGMLVSLQPDGTVLFASEPPRRNSS